MSGISSNLGYYLIGKQSGKGSVATNWFKFRAAENAPTLQPDKVVNRLLMTDDSRDQGASYLSSVAVKGDLPLYLHPDGIALILFLSLGSNADSGSSPNYTHTITPSDSGLPWFSVFRVVGNVITEQFVDCKVVTNKIEGKAGMPPVATLGIIGITPTWATVPVAPNVISGSPFIYWEGKNLLKIAGGAQPWSTFTWEINNNLKEYQADDYFLNDVDEGRRDMTFDFTMHFVGPTSEPKYREFIYGSDTGTTVGTGLVTKTIEFQLTRNAGANSVDINMTQARYAAVPVNPDPRGEPIEVKVAVEVERPVGGSICTATVVDQAATVG